jgi:hypothetical protein
MPPRRSKRTPSKKEEYKEDSDEYEQENPEEENKSTLADLLLDIGSSVDALRLCSSLAHEFKAIKKAYFKRILVEHPGI